MPQLIPVVLAVAAYAAAPAGALFAIGNLTVTYAAVFGAIAFAASTFAVNAIVSPGRGRAQLRSEVQDRKMLVRGTDEARQVIYGRARVSGALVYVGSSGANQQHLHLVIAFANHPCHAIGTVWLNGRAVEPADLNSSGMITRADHPMRGAARLIWRMGDQTAPPTELQAEAPDAWTSAHKLTGCTYLYLRITYDPDRMPNIPNVEAEVSGINSIVDVRTASSGYSNNWANCIHHYLTSENGLRTPPELIDLSYFVAAANLSDEAVLINGSGGTEPRYRLDGAFKLDRSPVDVLEQMLDAGGGFLVRVGGKFRLYGAAYRAPTGSIGPSDLAGEMQVVPRTARGDLFNAVKGLFVDPARDWGAHPFTPITDSALEAEDGGFRIWQEFQFHFVTRRTTAERLARMALQRHRTSEVVTVPLKFSAMRFCAGDVVAVTHPQLGWVNRPMMLMNWKFDPGEMVVKVELRAESAAAYATTWEHVYQGGGPPSTTVIDGLVVPAPSTPTVTATTVLQGDGAIVPALDVSWTAVAHAFVRQMEVQWRRTTDLGWQSRSVDAGTTQTTLAPVLAGIEYRVRVRAVAPMTRSDWSPERTVTAAADTTAPAVPSGLVSSSSLRGIQVSWIGVSDLDLDRYIVWERVGASDAWYVVGETYATTFVRQGLPPAVSRRYAISAVDRSGNQSARSAEHIATSAQVVAGDVADAAVPTFAIQSQAVTTLAFATASPSIAQANRPTSGFTRINLVTLAATIVGDGKVVLHTKARGAVFTNDDGGGDPGGGGAGGGGAE
jgi:hypothetical protein